MYSLSWKHCAYGGCKSRRAIQLVHMVDASQEEPFSLCIWWMQVKKSHSACKQVLPYTHTPVHGLQHLPSPTYHSHYKYSSYAAHTIYMLHLVLEKPNRVGALLLLTGIYSTLYSEVYFQQRGPSISLLI